jgi:hypothetical protein
VSVNRFGAAGLYLLVIALISLAGSSPAAASTQVGETFTPSGGAAACGNDRTWLQYALPSDGVITTWRFQADGSPPQLRLKVGRPTGAANQFTIIGESELKVPAVSQLNSYPIRVPVRAGDLIGLYTATMGDCLRGGPTLTTEYDRLGEAVFGSTSTFTANQSTTLDVAATLEPDCDGDGFGDETQDPVVDCIVPETQITKGPKQKAHKKKAKFEFSSSEPGATFECSLNGGAFEPCVSPDTVKAKRGMNNFEVRARDAAGNADNSPATFDWKVKKKKK